MDIFSASNKDLELMDIVTSLNRQLKKELQTYRGDRMSEAIEKNLEDKVLEIISKEASGSFLNYSDFEVNVKSEIADNSLKLHVIYKDDIIGLSLNKIPRDIEMEVTV